MNWVGGAEAFHGLTWLLANEPASVPDVASLAAHAGLDQSGLESLLFDHAQMAPGRWLSRARIGYSAGQLVQGQRSPADIAEAAGFVNVATFERDFLEKMHLTPAAYRALDGATAFVLRLPDDYRPEEVLAYQSRDPDGLAERSLGNRIWKALQTPDGPAVLELTIEPGRVDARVTAGRKPGLASMALLHGHALKVLGLVNDIDDFEKNHPSLARTRRGLRVPLIPSAFDALCWAIVGQQINLAFAGSLRRDLIMMAGTKIGGMIVHPSPDAVARLDPADLTSRRFSRSKARYLIDAAQAIVNGTLPVESLADGSAIEAERALIAQRGIGLWTARYVQLRIGFADAAPVGDSGLATALQRLHGLAERPDAAGTARLMAPFSPWRSLASMHLWASLRDPA
ncbi:DNA-3-methyladenine glycosylase 2 [Pinirhizobacter sp.]|jgi:AraC family transcriptional regulator of adaptative response / DNA-3-methyladenine glycosylase II|uniref:DNA-3-methyladenine glycosylase 2 n=1 Tax=Pinirhizobacter sp. TaxID=2950432 RepID=UPI002F42DA84